MKQYIEHMSYIVTYTYKDIKKSKKLFLNCFDVCLHQSVFWLGVTHNTQIAEILQKRLERGVIHIYIYIYR